MFQQVPGAIAAAVLLALTPAALRWWWGRSLSRLADDPVLPERLATHTRRVGMVAGGCAAALVIGWPRSAPWSVPVLAVAQTAAGFPLRKTLYQETWSLGAFLSFFGRLTIGAFGFWILLALTPWAAAAAGRFDWIAAFGLALFLFLWSRYAGDILRTLLATRPMIDRSLIVRFEALVTACVLPMPRFEYVAMNGGVVANAVAIPSLRGSSVVITDTLLSRLSEDEAVAICAHELAHLEHFDRTRLRRASIASVVLILIASAIAPLSRLTGSTDHVDFLLWPGLMCVALVLRARQRQANETASDRRAVALTGDPEALVRALTTLHTIARVPRRWEQQRERKATHPSLARRIRDIRASVGAVSTALEAPVTFRAAGGSAVVTFDASRLAWDEGSGTSQALEYAALVELRLDAAGSGAVALVAVERGGRRRQMAPEIGDVPALQAVLDLVDARLTHDTRVPVFSAAMPRLVACLGLLLGLTLGQLAFGFVALLACLAPAPGLLNAAGAAALTAALLALSGGLRGRLDTEIAVLFAVLGAVLLALGWIRRDQQVRGTRPIFALLAVSSALAVAAVAAGGFNAIRLHQGATSSPAALVLPIALAAAAWTWRRRAALRYTSIAAAVAAVGVFAIGTTAFLNRAGRDPFLVAAAPATRTVMDVPAMADFDVPFEVEALRLSPHGRLVALVPQQDETANDTRTAPRTFHVGAPGKPLSPVEADDFTFVDDARALTLLVRAGAAEVRGIDIASLAVAWRETVPDVRWGKLTYQARSNRWTVIGHDSAGRFVRATGTVGASDMQRTVWPVPPGREGWFEGLSARGSALLAVESQTEPGFLRQTWLVFVAPWLTQTHNHSEVWLLHDGARSVAARSVLDTSCVNDALDDDRLVCAAFDGTDTRIVALDPETGSVTALAMMNGRFRPDDVAAHGWLIGWWNAGAVAVQLATREVIQPRRRGFEDPIYLVTATDAVLGTVGWREEGSHVRLYPLRHERDIATP
jgi:Zn-dependent protease with chaperone function